MAEKNKRIQNLYELSPMQEGMLFHSLLNKDSKAYVEQRVFSLKGDVDSALFEESFNTLIQRYDIFRTAFVHKNMDEPVQVVLKERKYKMPFEDISHLPEEKTQEYLEGFKKKELERGFDLSKDLLMRIFLFKTGTYSYKLVWMFHHIVMDGWCLGIIFKDWFQVYVGLKSGKPVRLEPVTQYNKYIKWLQQQDRAEGLDYWREYLEGYERQAVLPKLANPVKAAKNSESQYRLEMCHVRLDETLSDALIILAKKHRVTLNILFQALWGLLLQRYNNTGDVVFGAVVSGRPSGIEGIENMVGLFINTVPVRVKSGSESFSLLLQTLYKESLVSKSNEYLPLAEIQANSALKGNLIDHIMVFENYPVQEEIKRVGLKQAAGFSIEGIDFFEQTSYDLDITVAPGKTIHVLFSFNSLVYSRDFVEKAALHFEVLARQVVESPGMGINKLEIITGQEKQQLLYDFNNTETAYPQDKTIHRWFAEQAAKTPDSIAVLGDQHLTYHQLNRRAGRLAVRLQAHGIGVYDIVAVMVERSPEMFVAVMAILKAGGAYLPIDPSYPRDRIAYMLGNNSTRALLTTGLLPGKITYEGEVIEMSLNESSRSGKVSKRLPTQPAQAGPSNLAYVIYTSGSTGRPKAVMVEHCQLVNAAYCWRQEYKLKEMEINLLQMASFSFDVFAGDLARALLNGGKLVICPEDTRLDPPSLYALTRKHRVTLFESTPGLIFPFMSFVYENSLEIEHLQLLILGSDICRVEDYKQLITRFGYRMRIVNSYGVTEATVDSSYYEEYSNQHMPVIQNVPIGKPLPNMRFYIMDRGMNLLPVGAVGELYISGKGVARGYLNNPELTAEKFVPSSLLRFSASQLLSFSLYRTGDLARWLPDGNVEFLGRIDQQVKIRGFRIELGEIENRLLILDNIKEAVVTAKDDGMGDKYLCAYIVSASTQPGGDLDAGDLKAYLSRSLPDYMIPCFFVPVETIPLTANGKVDRKVLPEPERKGAKETYAAPVDVVEEKLVELWADLLRVKKETLGIDDSFFELGGHSLKAIILVSRIHKEFNIEFPLSKVFATPTIREAARYIRGAETTVYQAITPVEKREYYPQSSAQKRLFFLDRFENIGTSYNMPLFLKLNGLLDKERFEGAFQLLIERYETLRTSFHLINNESIQKVHDYIDFTIEYQDKGPEAGREESRLAPLLVQQTIEHFVRPFDLSRAPLLRVGLVEISPQEHLLLFDMHHIITDGTSEEVLKDAFVRLYVGEPLPSLKVQYRDFSTWQNKLIETGRIKGQEDYWMNLFSNTANIPVLNLPLDYPRPAIFDFEGDYYRFNLGEETSRLLRRLSAQYGVTIFMNLVSALYVLLHKYTGQSDIIVGSGIAGRRHADLQQVIGLFVNMLALRNYPVSTKTYLGFLKEVKDTSIKAFENQDLQFEELVDKLELPRDASRNPLFDVAVVNQNFEKTQREIEALSVVPFELHENRAAKFDLTLFMGESPGNIHFHLEYYAGIFKRETVERLAAHFVNLVRQAAASPEDRIADIEIISEEERKQLLMDFNDTITPFPKDRTIHELFEEQAARMPDRTAVVFEDRALTYEELEAGANQLANYLYHEKNIRPDAPVGLMMDRSILQMKAILGILKAGGAYVPVALNFPEERIKNMIDDACIGVMVSEKRFIKTLNRLQWECPSFHTFICLDSRDVYAEEEVERSELMSRKLWEYVGETATDEITGGGWLSSYTGEPIPKAEMNEYGDNVLKKLAPLFHKEMRVLEIGCASGISMFRIAPHVGFYYGTDLSSVIIDKNMERVEKEGHSNIALACLPAHEIDNIPEKDFDLVIINSVIQCFHGHNYLRRVLRKAVDLLGDKGFLFIGDIMDQDLKKELIEDLVRFKQANKEKGYKTKTDWSEELFLSRDFFRDLIIDIPVIKDVKFSRKIYTIENELTGFRYDTLIKIDKSEIPGSRKGDRQKYQQDAQALERYGKGTVVSGATSANLAYIIYTSGSTGKPKGTLTTHANVVRVVRETNYIDLTPEDRVLQLSNYAFDGSVFDIYGAFLNGAVLVMLKKEDVPSVERLSGIMVNHGITVFFVTTALFNALVDINIRCLSGVRKVLFGGERVSVTHARRALEYLGEQRVMHVYGPTETTVYATYYDIDRIEPRVDTVPIGAPLANTTLYILDPLLKPVPIGVIGELYIGGDGVARGYLNNPELTAEKFVFSPLLRFSASQLLSFSLYRTGDLARWLPNGPLAGGTYSIEFTGRIDHQVKVRGFRIELGEIENHLLQNDDIKEAVVTVREGEGALCAYIVPHVSAPVDLDISQLKEDLSRELPDYMIPAFFVQLEELPLNQNGKVDKKALPEPGSEIGEIEGFAAPENETQRQLVEIWSEVLGIDKRMIGIDANFFELGGHSLKATLLVTKIHKKLNIKCPLAEVFRTPTVRGLAGFILDACQEVCESIEAAPAGRAYYPQSSAQKRLFFLDRMEGIDTSYNMPNAFIMAGNLDRERLENTFRELIRRHETLRTSFHLIDNEPVQKIHPEVVFEIERLDKNHINIVEHFIRPFDLSQAPLLRVGLAPLAAQEHLLIFDMHHIISDGTSMQILVNEVTRLYAGEHLPELRIQYKDFSWWQNELFETGKVKSQEQYWLDLYSKNQGEIPVLSLPTDYPRPETQDFRGAVYGFELEAEETAAFKELAAQNGATLFMNLLAAFNVLLHKYTDQEDIIVGSGIAGRHHADLQDIIGLFVNAMAIRNYPQPGKTYEEFLEEVKENCIKAFENQDFQFEELVRKLKLERDPARNPLFDIIFTHQNIERKEVKELEGLTFSSCNFQLETSEFDMSIDIYERENTIYFSLTYATALFKASTIERIAQQYMEVIRQVIQNQGIRLKDIELSHEFLDAVVPVHEEVESDFGF